MDFKALRETLISCALHALEQGWVHGSSGNFSVRDQVSGNILITPGSRIYTQLTPEDLPVIDTKGFVLEGTLNPSSELHMHLAIYRHREDVHAIVHTHPPFSLVFAAAEKPIPMVLTEAAQHLGGSVRVAPYCKPGTSALADSVIAHIGSSSAILLARHGLVTTGRTPDEAMQATTAVETAARTLILMISAGFIPLHFSQEEAENLEKDFKAGYHREVSGQ